LRPCSPGLRRSSPTTHTFPQRNVCALLQLNRLHRSRLSRFPLRCFQQSWPSYELLHPSSAPSSRPPRSPPSTLLPKSLYRSAQALSSTRRHLHHRPIPCTAHLPLALDLKPLCRQLTLSRVVIQAAHAHLSSVMEPRSSSQKMTFLIRRQPPSLTTSPG